MERAPYKVLGVSRNATVLVDVLGPGPEAGEGLSTLCLKLAGQGDRYADFDGGH